MDTKSKKEILDVLKPFAEIGKRVTGWDPNANCGIFPQVKDVHRARELYNKLAKELTPVDDELDL